MQGVYGRLLEIDLSGGTASDLPVPEAVFQHYIGGRGLGARLLFDLLPAGTDPLAPENILFFLTGPLSGTRVPGSSKFVVITKSPLTNAWCDSYSSGRLPIELKKLGYDGILVRGRANHPCYLKIDAEGVHIKGADAVWGKDSFETDRILKEIEKSPTAGVTTIGPAGEKLCRFACINSELYRQAGRGGVGGVMGSKNLKAIVIKGNQRMEPYDGAKLTALNQKNFAKSRQSQVALARMKYGTPLTLNITHAGGILPTKNFQRSTWDRALDRIDSKGVEASVTSHKGCISCFTPCGLMTRVSHGKYKGTELEGPEYETLSMFGSNQYIDSLPAIIQANVLCDKLGLDTISTGNVIGFMMECFERGLLTPSLTEGLDFSFGNEETCLKAIEMTAARKGLGDLLSQGVRILAEHVGQDSQQFAMHVKGMEFPGYEPRGAFASGLSYAVSPRGACHRRAWPPTLEILGDAPPYTAEGKAQLVKRLYDENCILHSLLVCDMPAKFIPLPMEEYSAYLQAVSGRWVDPQDFLHIADRIETLIRLFNLREGLTRRDDTLPHRTLYEPLPDGPGKGQCIGRKNLDRMIDEYYALRGWDAAGVPTPETLKKHQL